VEPHLQGNECKSERASESYEVAILTVGTEGKVVRIGSRGDDHAVDNLRDFAHACLLGLVTSYTLGGFIHILLVLAVVVLVINLVQGRRVA
jgi:hypothetical protein